MNTINSNFASKSLSDDEKRRLDRQLRLPGWNQGYLKRSTVLIVGIGGLGVEIAKNLAMVSVGRLILVDLDIIEYSNLNRQVLFVGAPEGASKSEFAAMKIRELNPHVKVEAFNSPLQDLPPRIYHEADLYIAGLDSIEARMELNRRAVHNLKPMIDAGTSTYNGHIYCIFPGKNSCLECDPLREREQDQLGACTLVGKPRRPAHCILKGQLYFEQKFERSIDIIKPDEVKIALDYANDLLIEHFPGATPFNADQVIQIIDNHEPTVITINCVMASIQSQEAVKILHHVQSPPDGKRLGTLQLNYIIYNGLSGKFYEIEKKVNPDCSICGPKRTPLYRIKVKQSFPLKKIIDKLAESKQLPVDPEFPPSVFRIDSSSPDELNLEASIQKNGIRDYETILVTGFEDGKQVYLQIKIEE
ncbi:MAG: HesA/MoeB/ThiF family protein [Candidatus Hodarchaeales archaeon]|jgi:molybdopterin/thiamine biosynthesis adenylyltransferase